MVIHVDAGATEEDGWFFDCWPILVQPLRLVSVALVGYQVRNERVPAYGLLRIHDEARVDECAVPEHDVVLTNDADVCQHIAVNLRDEELRHFVLLT
jgi:hypothetical protein